MDQHAMSGDNVFGQNSEVYMIVDKYYILQVKSQFPRRIIVIIIDQFLSNSMIVSQTS